jgi:hypothetical protein
VTSSTAKAQHIIELRQTVDSMRALAGRGGAHWNDPGLAAGDPIKSDSDFGFAEDLNDAGSRLGYSTSAYTDPLLSSGFPNGEGKTLIFNDDVPLLRFDSGL